MANPQGEASAIAERWRHDASLLDEGAQMLRAAAIDIRAGNGLVGSREKPGMLTRIADLIEELQRPDETLEQTYVRVKSAVAAMDRKAKAGKTPEQIVRLAVGSDEP